MALVLGPASAPAQPVPPVAPTQPVPPVTVETLPIPDAALEPLVVPLPLNRVHLVELSEPVRDVIIANPEVADVIVKTPRQAYLVARSIGDTNVFFVSGDGRVVEHLLVQVSIDIEAAEEAMATLLPNSRIEPTGAGSSIVLNGTVRSAKDSADAAAIARRFVEEDENVVNLLRILEDQQVLLQVRVAEVTRNVLKDFTFNTNFNRVIRDRNVQFTTRGGDTQRAAVIGSIVLDKFGLTQSTFISLERQGLVKTLAEPALTAISGETANFLAGGEIPVVSGVDSNGNLIIEFREFGVSLSFTPVVLSGDQIRLRIATEVSRPAAELKLTLSVGGNAVDVTGRRVNRADNTVTLPSGGGLMIAGLLQNDEFNQIDGTPWLKEIPILGALFRSEAFQRNQTELIVLVTAYLVRPPASPRALALPSDGFVTASDFDLYLMSRLYKRYSKRKDIKEIPVLREPFGYIME